MNDTQPDQAVEPKLASEVAERFELSDDARALLAPDHTPSAYFALLGRRELYRDAFAFAAHYLPRRKAIWWGCLCAWELFRNDVPAGEESPLAAVVGWVRQPSEENRRRAYETARDAARPSVSANLAMAVFSADGSLSKPDGPHVDPKPHQAARFVTAAVVLAGQLAPREQRKQFQHHFLEFAVELSRDGAPWEQAAEENEDAASAVAT
ncbi:MAG: hypothetical protein RIC55_28620 [Pirellulaceae bacterium]